MAAKKQQAGEVTLKQTAVILRDGAQVSLEPGTHKVSADELKILTDAGLVADEAAAEEAPAGEGEQQ